MLKSQKDFINYWKFLEIPMNAPLGYIKLAFASKLERIEKHMNKRYTLKDLKTCIKAYETLTDPYSRYFHNCKISGKAPKDINAINNFIDGLEFADEDLSIEGNENFIVWLFCKIDNYKLASKKNNAYKKIVESLSNQLRKESKKLAENIIDKPKNKNSQPKNKKCILVNVYDVLY